MRERRLSLFVLACALVLCTGSQTYAQIVTLTDLNSIVQINTGLQSGQFLWSVDGVDHLSQQWFWYRIGDQGPEASIETISPPQIGLFGPRYLTTLYTGPAFSVEVDYLLTGGTAGSRTSDIAESIRIINLSGGVLPFHFFQYVDFDLNGTAGGDFGKMVNANTVQQWKPGVVLTETVDTPGPAHHELAFLAQTLTELNNGSATTLNDFGGPIGPGDVTWAFQWDVNIAPGDTLLISKDKRITPEPITLALLAMGGLFLRRCRR